jgi:citrate synthase
MVAPKGLEGLIVADTEISDVRGREGFYHYRQYSAVELAKKRSLEDVWYLVYNGELPSRAEREEFVAEVKRYTAVPDPVRELLPKIAAVGDPFDLMKALRSAYSLTASHYGFKATYDVDAETLRRYAMQTAAVVPTLLTSLYRLHHGKEPIEPKPELSHAANYLYTALGEVPSDEHVRAVEQYMILTLDHGFNASTFTARVITSTGADLGSAVLGAMGSLSGPLHGGAPTRALAMLDAIGSPENTERWLREQIQGGGRLMGFGHRVYKTEDPRSAMLKELATQLRAPQVDFAKHVESRALTLLEEMKPGHELHTNVEFYAGVVMDAAGVPREMFTPTFLTSRVMGWTAHIMEQAASNRIMRPLSRYVGPPPPQPVPDPE